MKLVTRITINWPVNLNSVHYLKRFCGNLANECPTLEDMNWDKYTGWSIYPWQFNTEENRNYVLDSIKENFETDGGRWTGSKERPFICDILKLELFDYKTHKLLAEKTWAPKGKFANIA